MRRELSPAAHTVPQFGQMVPAVDESLSMGAANIILTGGRRLLSGSEISHMLLRK